tara:strand:- start:612 stop:797 length:186 start_codon:yes stop_codon:yes gene_type:complete
MAVVAGGDGLRWVAEGREEEEGGEDAEEEDEDGDAECGLYGVRLACLLLSGQQSTMQNMEE